MILRGKHEHQVRAAPGQVGASKNQSRLKMAENGRAGDSCKLLLVATILLLKLVASHCDAAAPAATNQALGPTATGRASRGVLSKGESHDKGKLAASTYSSHCGRLSAPPAQCRACETGGVLSDSTRSCC